MAGSSRIRREDLADALAAGESVEQAMLAAGYSPKTAGAGQISYKGRHVNPWNHPEVAARVAEIREIANQRAVVTVEDLVDELNRAYEKADQLDKPSSMIAATNSKAKLLGLAVDKVDVNMKNINDMTRSEIERFMQRNATPEELAEFRAEEAAKRSAGEPPPPGQRRVGRRVAGTEGTA